MSEPVDDARFLDETLDPEDPVAPGARDEMLAHRYVHGLLRAMNTADAAAHESRVRSILASLPPSASRRRTTHRVAVLAASLLVIGLIGFLATGSDAPRVDALVKRAAAKLRVDVDRRYDLSIRVGAVGIGTVPVGRHRLTVRPGGRFLLEVRGVRGRQVIGCDGETVWGRSGRDGDRRWALPLADHERLEERLHSVGLLDVGYLDLERLVTSLPNAGDLHVAANGSDTGGAGPLRIEARELAGPWRFDVRNVVVLFDEVTEQIVHVELDMVSPGRRGEFGAHLTFEYVGVVDPDDERYRKPW